MPPRTQPKLRDSANLRARFLGISQPIGNEAVSSVRCRVSNRAINDIRGLKILILRAGALGDLLLTLPVLDEIRSNLPQSFIEVWGVQPQASLIQSADRVDRLDALDVAPLFIAEPVPPVLRGRLREFDLAISFLADPGGVVAQNLVSAGVQRAIKATPAKGTPRSESARSGTKIEDRPESEAKAAAGISSRKWLQCEKLASRMLE